MTTTVVEGRDPRTGRPIQVGIRGRRVESICPFDGPAELWISPGLVDLQVNGFAGLDVNSPDVDTSLISELVRSLHRVGVTTVVPTIVTAAEQRIVSALSVVARARAIDPAVAYAVPYVHIEGPFLSDQEGPRGAHDVDEIRAADVEEFRRWQRASGDLVGMLTISPHDDRAIELIAAATRSGVRCSIGHTHASPEQIARAADAGAKLSTHLGNGAHAYLPRHPNYIWAQLADERLAAGFIADGHHLSADTFRAMLRAKGKNRAHLVSDATALAGSPPGRYHTPVGGDVELSSDGRLSVRGTPFLAGAARSLADGVALAVVMANITLADGLRLATSNPGRFVGNRGTLRSGRSADLILFRWKPGDVTLDVHSVIVAGVSVFGPGVN